ncbi:GTP cyclohydrolase II [Chitinilyticum litopenaei]|uniref:GTP cyclohydrolase II n=1 Tax=Chitinilyticum litopenaei TaxID=1121276 RepID=UPI003570B4D3
MALLAEAPLATRHGVFHSQVFRLDGDPNEHMVLIAGDPAQLGGDEPLLCRIHSECLTGDVLGSVQCDCGAQLDAALRRIAHAGRGMLIYLRGQEGRGIGLSAKIRAYALQHEGMDTLDANLALGLPAEARSYAAASAILAFHGVRTVRLLTNNPEKIAALEAAGIAVQREASQVGLGERNRRYLLTKQQRMGHLLDLGQG